MSNLINAISECLSSNGFYGHQDLSQCSIKVDDFGDSVSVTFKTDKVSKGDLFDPNCEKIGVLVWLDKDTFNNNI